MSDSVLVIKVVPANTDVPIEVEEECACAHQLEDPMEPDVMPSSKIDDPRLNSQRAPVFSVPIQADRRSFRLEAEADIITDIGKSVTPLRKFAPTLHGRRFAIDPDDRQIYTVESVEPARNFQVSLRPYGGGELVLLTPQEFRTFMEVLPGQTRPEHEPEISPEDYKAWRQKLAPDEATTQPPSPVTPVHEPMDDETTQSHRTASFRRKSS